MKLLYLLVIVLVLVGIAFVPFATIWALNTLFALAIPYTLSTWGAVVVLNLTWMSKYAINRN